VWIFWLGFALNGINKNSWEILDNLTWWEISWLTNKIDVSSNDIKLNWKLYVTWDICDWDWNCLWKCDPWKEWDNTTKTCVSALPAACNNYTNVNLDASHYTLGTWSTCYTNWNSWYSWIRLTWTYKKLRDNWEPWAHKCATLAPRRIKEDTSSLAIWETMTITFANNRPWGEEVRKFSWSAINCWSYYIYNISSMVLPGCSLNLCSM
jgi:hypothetical protein